MIISVTESYQGRISQRHFSTFSIMMTQVLSKSFFPFISACSMCSLQKKKVLLPSSVINFHWAGQQKTIPPRGICTWPSVGCNTMYLGRSLSTRCAAALIHRPATERTWEFTNNKNKYISSFTPRTVFLNKQGEALRRNWGTGILKHRASLHSMWWLLHKQHEV